MPHKHGYSMRGLPGLLLNEWCSIFGCSTRRIMMSYMCSMELVLVQVKGVREDVKLCHGRWAVRKKKEEWRKKKGEKRMRREREKRKMKRGEKEKKIRRKEKRSEEEKNERETMAKKRKMRAKNEKYSH